MKPLYHILGGVLLLLVGLGLYVLFTGDHPAQEISSTSTPVREGRTEPKRTTTVTIEKGTTLTALAKRHYGMTDHIVLDLVLQANPKITNVHLLLVNQKVELPSISAESFLVPASDHGYKVHVGTVTQKEAAGRFENDPALKGKKIEIVALPVSTQQTWYRVLASTFQTKEEALQAIRGVRNTAKIVGIVERTERAQQTPKTQPPARP